GEPVRDAVESELAAGDAAGEAAGDAAEVGVVPRDVAFEVGEAEGDVGAPAGAVGDDDRLHDPAVGDHLHLDAGVGERVALDRDAAGGRAERLRVHSSHAPSAAPLIQAAPAAPPRR